MKSLIRSLPGKFTSLGLQLHQWGIAGCLGLSLVGSPLTAAQAAEATNPLGPIEPDRSIDPCDDFYQFACANWIKVNPIPADQSQWGTFNALNIHNRDTLHALLDRVAASPTPDSEKVSAFYAACMDEAGIDKAGLISLKPDLDRIAQLSDKAALPALVAHLHEIGVNVFFEFGSEPDNKNSTQEIAGIDQGGFGLPDRDYYTKTDPKSVKTREDYRAHIANMLGLLSDDKTAATASAETVLKVETLLAQDAFTKVQRRDPVAVYHLLPTENLAKMASDFDWNSYVVATDAPKFAVLNIHEPHFIEGLGQALSQISLDDVKTYLRWHLVHRAATLLPKPFVDENFSFYGKILQGAAQLEPRWRRCVQATDNSIGEALGKLYIDQEFPPNAKARTEQLIKDLRAAYAHDLGQIPWMGATTRKIALGKLDAMAEKIGYPDKWRDYSSLFVKRDDALGNSERAAAFETHRDLKKIGGPVDRSEWEMTPPTVNAYYDPLNNDINFPAGILQPPFFDASGDDAGNYGAIGAVIGHEMTHGFDDEGRQYDAKGNLANWWNAKDEAQFKDRAQCLIDEYGGFTAVDEVKVNGALTLGENTADNGGVRLAYAALIRHLDKKSEPKMDGFTPQQRFFLSFAHVWCGETRPETARLRALTDPHAPMRYRVNGVLANMTEFRQAFSCAPEKAMASKKSCQVW